MVATFNLNVLIFVIFITVIISCESKKIDELILLPGLFYYDTAVRMCKEKGMSLVRIDDAETNNIVFHLAKKRQLKLYWIDANKKDNQREFFHIDGSKLLYHNWQKDEPNNLETHENCICSGFDRGGFWYDAPCSYKMSTICNTTKVSSNNDQFIVLPQPINFETAVKTCKDKGMSLVRIDDAATNKIVYEYAVRKKLSKHWIDANDQKKENEFLHIDQTKVIYTNWHKNEPSDTKGNENCVYIGSETEGYWYDINCQDQILGICNKTEVPPNDDQFHLLPVPQNFETAVKMCQDKGMSLIKIDNDETNRRVYEFAMRKKLHLYWMDARKNNSTKRFVHLDDSRLDYTNWHRNEPNNHKGAENCICSGINNEAFWFDIPCSDMLFGICNTTKALSNTDQFIALPQPVNFETAVKMCEEKGMSLVRIDDAETNKIVYEYAVRKHLMVHWIDANDQGKENEFVHIDGSKVIYKNWEQTQPDNFQNNQHCVRSGVELKGFWDDIFCHEKYIAICNATVKLIKTDPPHVTEQPYVTYPSTFNHSTALKLCKEKGRKVVRLNHSDPNYDMVFYDFLSLMKINLNSFKTHMEKMDNNEDLFIFSQSDTHGPVNDKRDENIAEILRLNNELLKCLKLGGNVYVICYGDE